MRVRLVPVGEIFRRMPFVVRDLARETVATHPARPHRPGHGNRQVRDRADDGSGSPSGSQCRQPRHRAARRADGGRQAAGRTIRLSASTLGESAVLEVSDDGRGMDARPIAQPRASAGPRRGGWSHRCPGPARRDLLPGFSTRDAADRASGRGVGMAVVRDAFRSSAGRSTLDTRLGAGTTFRARAAADAGDHRCADRSCRRPHLRGPASARSREVAEVDRRAFRVIENNELMTHRGAALPIVRLAQLFSLRRIGARRGCT